MLAGCVVLVTAMLHDTGKYPLRTAALGSDEDKLR